jgi:hypothetical protein
MTMWRKCRRRNDFRRCMNGSMRPASSRLVFWSLFFGSRFLPLDDNHRPPVCIVR